jgi:hypothetical protein
MNKPIDRLGYYLVGFKKFYHKTLALIESKKTGYVLIWVFNDEAYGSIDWSVPIQENLDELYRRRAQQLRDSYDYLALYFSGGADSSNMLRVFLTNNIFIDEIVMQIPEPARKSCNGIDTSNVNHFSEIDYSAVPILNELKNQIHPNTFIRYQDTSRGLIELFEKDNWFEHHPFGVTLALNPLARQHTSFTDKHILKLCDTGKRIAQIIGTDKPLLMYDGKDYYSYFIDVTALHAPPVDLAKREIWEKSYHTEFFYWTPDMPEIAVKQAQEVKLHCELNHNIRNIVCNTNIPIGELRSILHPIIYPSMPEVPFQVAKSSHEAVRKKDRWFWETASESQKFNYQLAINYLNDNINSEHFKSGDIGLGMNCHLSKLYKL